MADLAGHVPGDPEGLRDCQGASSERRRGARREDLCHRGRDAFGALYAGIYRGPGKPARVTVAIGSRALSTQAVTLADSPGWAAFYADGTEAGARSGPALTIHYGAHRSATMQNTDGQQNLKPVSVTARALDKTTTRSGLLSLIRGVAADIAVRLAVWADDPRNHEESLSLRSTAPALPTQEPSGR